MKILHIGKFYPPFMGGIENFMADLMSQQVLDDHQVTAIVHHHEKTKPFVKEQFSGVSVYRIPYIGQLAYAPISPSFGYYLKKVIQQEQPDVLHIHMPNLSAFWCLLLPTARKIPWVIHWHADVLGSVPDIKIKLLYPFYRILEQAVLKKASRIIATSSVYFESSEPLKKFLGKVRIIPLGLRVIDDNLDSTYNEVSNVSDRVNLLMIGRLTYYKGHSIILSALARLKTQHFNFKLSIVGGGELHSDIEQQIKSLNLTDSVKLLGKLSDDELNIQLADTDILCLPSIERTEAFGVVLLEAMRAGKPCLVTDVPGSGMSWVVQDNITGFVVKHNSVNSLVNKLNFISSNLKLLEQYGEAGRRRFDSVFSIGTVTHEISTLYNDVVVATNSKCDQS